MIAQLVCFETQGIAEKNNELSSNEQRTAFFGQKIVKNLIILIDDCSNVHISLFSRDVLASNNDKKISPSSRNQYACSAFDWLHGWS